VAGLDGGRSERVSYREAGAAQRAATARANQLADRLTARDLRVLGAVFAETTTYSKLTAFVYIAKVAELAGVHRPDAGKSIRKLAELGIIVWVPGRGRQSKSLIGMPADTAKRERQALSFTESGREPEKRATVAPPTRREQENEKKALAKTAAGRAIGASPARSRAKARCAADAALPAEGFEPEDKEKRSSWVTGEPPTVPAYPAPATSVNRQSAATTVAELERDDGDRQVDGDAGYSAPGSSDPTGHDDVPAARLNETPSTVPPELKLALPRRLNADIVRLAAEHYAATPLAVLAIAGRATTADDPARYFSTSLRGSIQNDELNDRQAQLEHEATDPEPREPRKAITGARWVRGETGATYVQDPLGTDQPPPGYGWPHPKPTPEEILEARNASKPTPRTS